MKNIVVYDTDVKPEESTMDKVYRFIVNFATEKKHSPLLADIMKHMKWSSTSSCDRHIKDLTRKGMLESKHKDALIASLPKEKIYNLMNPKQYRVYEFVLQYFKQHNRLPVLKEIANKFDINLASAHKYKTVFKRKKIYKLENEEITHILDLETNKYLKLFNLE